MAQLSDSSIQILDGTVTLTKRNHSSAWQARYKIGNKWLRATTKQKELERAKKVAQDIYLRARFREDEGLPIVTKRFDAVARIVKSKLRAALDANEGKKVYKDYITAIDKYLIPFFGSYNITSIDYALVKKFADWRDTVIGHKTKASTINTHNSTLNRIFEEGVTQNYLNKTQIPLLQNKGVKSERRPHFTLDEYRQLVKFMRKWVTDNAHLRDKSIDMRFLLRDYVLILANTGMRHGTESYGIKWKHLSWYMDGGKRILMISVDGKTKQRELVARHNCARYFERIQKRCDDIKHLTFDELIAEGRDEYVFRLNDGTRTVNLKQTFTKLMKDSGLLVDRATNTNRTLYSLRHTYATFALLYSKTPVFDLEVQMGTSVAMIRKHYAHISARVLGRQLAGHDYDEEKQRKVLSAADNDADED